MKLNIEIHNNSDIKLLRKWASVSRTFDEAERLLLEYSALLEFINRNVANFITQSSDPVNQDAERYFQIQDCLEELTSLHQPLSNLHYIVRSAMWEQYPLKEKV